MDGEVFESMMAQHWLPVQGFDEDLANSALGEVRSNIGGIEKVSMNIVCLHSSPFLPSYIDTFPIYFLLTSLPVYPLAVLSQPTVYDSNE